MWYPASQDVFYIWPWQPHNPAYLQNTKSFCHTDVHPHFPKRDIISSVTSFDSVYFVQEKSDGEKKETRKTSKPLLVQPRNPDGFGRPWDSRYSHLAKPIQFDLLSSTYIENLRWISSLCSVGLWGLPAHSPPCRTSLSSYDAFRLLQSY